jgi:L-aminopeptidase/D-esterase-like protein
MLVQEVNAVLLSGGSAFGLAAASGVVRWLEEREIGFDTGIARVPIVPAAVLFDLGVGDPRARPAEEAGYAACEAASYEAEEGAVGAGVGATVAKLHGPERAVPGGIGTAAVEEGGVTVGAIAAVNAFGEIVDDDGTAIAGAEPPGEAGSEEGDELRPPFPGPTNTTIAVVATDAKLTKERAHLLAIAAHDGLARAVRPAHTMWDGDTIFTLATGRTEAPQPLVERMAAEALARAIRRGVQGGSSAASEASR